MIVRAPAKVNLLLRVLGRRSDGYHELDTLMFPVSLYDTITITAAPSLRTRVTCRCSGPEKVPGGAGNLAARAATAVLEELGEHASVAIRLHKVIPFGAGLGGGSSDAAAILRALPRLLGRRIAAPRLHRIATSLGADVPFFLACRPARAQGIGERLSPHTRTPSGALVIAVPADRVDTAWAYRHALGRLTSGRAASRSRPLPRDIDAVEAWFFNDFQRGVERSFASVRQARQRLGAVGAIATVLSGSGSAVVGWFANEALARRAASDYAGPGKAFAARVIRSAPRARPASPETAEHAR